MPSTIIIIVAALIGGALIAAQGPIYARMALEFQSPITATWVAFVIATCAITTIAFALKAPLPNITTIQSMPKWAWLGALVGVYQVLVSVNAVPKLGVANFIMLVVFGQIVAAQIYDHFGWFELRQRTIGWRELVGVGLMAAGVGAI
jgi:transporter family-2 protein